LRLAGNAFGPARSFSDAACKLAQQGALPPNIASVEIVTRCIYIFGAYFDPRGTAKALKKAAAA
jgi:hypothetical protein